MSAVSDVRKACKKCGLSKDLDSFSRSKGGAHGRRSDCKLCVSAYKAAIRRANPEAAKEAGRRSCRKHAEKRRAYSLDWYYRNIERSAVKAKRYRALNNERMREVGRMWEAANRERLGKRRKERATITKELARLRRLKNPEAARCMVRNRRARLKAAEGRHTADEVNNLFKIQRGRCANPLCRKSLADGYHADHIKPIVSGGTNWIRNIQLLCGPCNVRKNATDPVEWAQRLGLLI